MAKKMKFIRLLPVFKSQEMLLSLGLILSEDEHRAFLERPTWHRWKDLMQRDLASQLERALSAGEIRQAELDEIATQVLTESELSFLPGVSVTPAMFAEALFSRDVPAGTPLAMIEDFLNAAMNQDSHRVSQIVEAAEIEHPAQDLDDEKLLTLAPVERVLRLQALLAA